jgi:hypothetical protein
VGADCRDVSAIFDWNLEAVSPLPANTDLIAFECRLAMWASSVPGGKAIEPRMIGKQNRTV